MIRIKTERLIKSILTLKALIVGKVLRVKNTGQGVPAGAVAEDKRIKGKEKEALGGRSENSSRSRSRSGGRSKNSSRSRSRSGGSRGSARKRRDERSMSKSESDFGDEVGVLAEVHETRFQICLQIDLVCKYRILGMQIWNLRYANMDFFKTPHIQI